MNFQTLEGLTTYLICEEERLVKDGSHCYVVVESPGRVIVYDRYGKEIAYAGCVASIDENRRWHYMSADSREDAIQLINNRFSFDTGKIEIRKVLESDNLKRFVGETFWLTPLTFFTDVILPKVPVRISSATRKEICLAMTIDKTWIEQATEETKESLQGMLRNHKAFIVTR